MTEHWRGVHVPDDEGRLLVFQGTQRRLKVTSEQTEGLLTAFMSTYPDGVPHGLHIHHDAIESWFFVKGAARFYVDGAIMEVRQGAFLSVPRGVVHGFVPIAEGTRALVMFTPAGAERFWEEVARATADGTFDEAFFQDLGQRTGGQWIGPLPEEMLGH